MIINVLLQIARDPVRYWKVFKSALNLRHIPGNVVECGVYKGSMSKFLLHLFPRRTLYLFDTFSGFDSRDSLTKGDLRFQDTSVAYVQAALGKKNLNRVKIRAGWFPRTAKGLEKEKFVFVMIDFDKYEPTLAALKFFYPRVSPGGCIFVHDYNSPESDWACYRAVNSFMRNKPEKITTIHDVWGSIMIRKK